MENSEKKNEEEMNGDKDSGLENLSADEILNKIEKDASEENANENATEETEGSDIFKKLGFSKKDKLKRENEELTKSLIAEKQKTSEANDKFLRLYAEFDNFKKRTLKERLDLIKTAGAEVIISLLPVLDDFSRAIKQMESSNESNTSIDGVKLIQQKIVSILESKGLKAMNSIGEAFNADLHDAITEVSVEDENKNGKVIDEIECGYFLNEKIIRHAKVIVGKTNS